MFAESVFVFMYMNHSTASGLFLWCLAWVSNDSGCLQQNLLKNGMILLLLSLSEMRITGCVVLSASTGNVLCKTTK